MSQRAPALARRRLAGHGLIRAAALAAQIASVASCTPPEAGTSTCLDDAACANGSICAFGLCIDANDGRLDTVDLEVEPLSSTGLPAQSVFGVDARAAGDDRVDIDLRRAATVRGTATLLDGGKVSGQVSATPGQSIAGRMRLPTAPCVDGEWAMPLVDGEVYRVALVPDDDDVAPAVADADVVAGSGGDVALSSCHLARFTGDATTCAVIVTGRVVAGAGAAARGVPALQVRIADATGRRVSTLARTDDAGAFTLALPATVAGAILEVRGTVDNALQPAIAQPIVLPTALPGEPPVTDVDLGVITQGTRAETLAVAGRVTTAGGAPARAATVVMRAATGAGIYVARATTDDDGGFAVAARPGTYDVAAVGSSDGDDGLFVGRLVVEAAVLDAVFTLAPRSNVTLAIQRRDGGDVVGASVALQRVGDALGVAEPVLVDAQPLFLAATDDDGIARLRVAAGRYRVTVEPPRDSGAPVFSALLAVDGPLTRTLELPGSIVLAGTVRAPDDGVTSGAVVRVFSPFTDEQGRAIFLGEAVSATDGSFSVAVPQLRP